MHKPLIEVRGVRKIYDNGTVGLKNVDFTVFSGEVVCIVGPSGGGKSTLLRTLNALETITAGDIVIDGISVHDKKTNLNSLRRHLGMVFQSFNLFGHKSVLENIILAPCTVLKLPKAEAVARAHALLAKVGLVDKADARPSQLSGGQAQRVAIARALAMQPRVLLFDEPTSALDPEKVGEVLEVMRALAQDGMTMVVVTHEMAFARAVASRMVFMEDGEIAFTASPEQFFNQTENTRLCEFLGQILPKT